MHIPVLTQKKILGWYRVYGSVMVPPCWGWCSILLGKSSTNKVQQSNNKHSSNCCELDAPHTAKHGAYLLTYALHIVCSAARTLLSATSVYLLIQWHRHNIYLYLDGTLQMKIRKNKQKINAVELSNLKFYKSRIFLHLP